jgi:D-glycero-D-manno-heptose 1,7-bisphosphate phosphatase
MGVKLVTGRAVFLDRDGVLNETWFDAEGVAHPPATVASTAVSPGARDACDHLRKLGFRLIAITNQPDVARGTQLRDVVEAINAHVRTSLDLDDVRTCFHDDADGCDCRKPLPGLILKAAVEWDVDPRRSYVIGDRWRDIEAGARAGCVTLLVQKDRSQDNRARADHTVDSLLEAARWIARRERGQVEGGRWTA